MSLGSGKISNNLSVFFMKKLFYFASLLAVVAGCTKEVTPIEKPTTGTYTLLAEFAQGTKSTINDETGAMTWSVNDHISVLSDDGEINADFTLSGGQPTNMGVFTGDFEGTPVFAVYPFNEDNIAVDDQVDIYLPCEYEYNGEETHAPMLASIETTDELTTGTAKFKHVAGLIKVTYENVPLSAKYFEFTATKQITGTFSVDSEGKISATTGDDRKSVSYDINNTEEYTDMVFYVPVPCGVYGFNVALLDENMDTIANTGRKVSNTTISVGQYYIAPTITLKKPVWEENFTANVEDTDYASSKSFNTAANISTYDYSWSLTSGSTATVGHDFVKTGKSGVAGSIQNSDMLVDIATGTNFTVKVFAANWPKKETDVYVEYNGKKYSSKLTSAPSASENDYNASDFVEYDFVFQKTADVNLFVVGGTNERVLIDKIIIAEGGELPSLPVDKTIADFIAAEGGACYLTGVVSNITGTTYGNYTLTDNSGSIVVYGTLNQAKEPKKFAELGVVAGDKIKVLATEYEFFNNTTPEAKNVEFVEFVERVPRYAVTIASGITNGTVTVDYPQAVENQTVTITATPASGYKVKSVSAKKTASGTALTVTDNKFDMPAEDVTVSAEFELSQDGGDGGEKTTGTIKFGTNDVKISAASVTGVDNLGNTWTITTEGTTSYTTNAAYYQVGSSKAPATSITFTTTLPSEINIESMSAKFGGFSGTTGTVTMKVGETTVGTGSLNATNDVVINSTSSATGKVLTVTVTDIDKGVKVYNISYSYPTAK